MELTREQMKQFQEDIRILKFQMQENQDTLEGGLTSRNLVSFRNTYVINAQDSLDASYPMYVHFNIISEMIKIVSVKVSFWLLNYRAYSTAASSGGAVSSASGGGETPTSSSGGVVSSASGGGETPTSSSGGAVSSASGGGETPTSSSVSTPSGGGSTSGATGSASGGSSTSGNTGSASGGGDTSGAGTGTTHSVLDSTNLTAHEGAYLVTGAAWAVPGLAHTHTTPAHTHPNHSHTTPAHTHPNHTHSTPAHAHPAHTHTVTVAAHTHTGGAHTHTVTIAAHTHTGGAHTHTVTVAAHTHTGGAHTHGITYGIFEDSTSPIIKFYVSENEGVSYDDTFFGGYDADKKDLEITSLLAGAGSKLIKFESDLRARLSVQIEIKVDIKAR